jgi:hemerythrin
MPYIDFTEKLSVKNTMIDEQHKQLIAIMNDLHQVMAAGKARAAIYEILGRMIDYTKTHFTAEERLMAVYTYPERKSHEGQHAELIRQIDELKAKVQAGQIAVTIETMEFLKKWLNNHILNTDKKLGEYLGGKGVK